MILFQINDRVIRYGALKKTIPGISEKMLIENKLVSKKAYPEIPPKVEYWFTELGLKTLPIVDKLAQLGLENLV